MDFMVNLPSSAIGDLKFNSLMVIEDYLTKMTRLIPTTTNVKAEGVAKLYFDNIYKLHGLPRGIVSDRDSKFTGHVLASTSKDGWHGPVNVHDGTSTDRRSNRTGK
jgi:hypothetical protein